MAEQIRVPLAPLSSVEAVANTALTLSFSCRIALAFLRDGREIIVRRWPARRLRRAEVIAAIERRENVFRNKNGKLSGVLIGTKAKWPRV